MASNNSRTPHLIGAAIGAMMLVAGATASGTAQQIDSRNQAPAARPTGVSPEPGSRDAARKSSKPIAGAAQRTSGKPAAPEPSPKAWSLDDALPNKSPAASSRDSDPSAGSKPALGRIPLQSGAGTFGFETETKVKSTELPGGQRVPGVESSPHQPPSYLGLSISVPTDKAILPGNGTPWSRPD